jgi:hypothetical protein
MTVRKCPVLNYGPSLGFIFLSAAAKRRNVVEYDEFGINDMGIDDPLSLLRRKVR